MQSAVVDDNAVENGPHKTPDLTQQMIEQRSNYERKYHFKD